MVTILVTATYYPYWSRLPRAGSRGHPAGTPLLLREGVPPAGCLRRAQVPPSNWGPLRGVRRVGAARGACGLRKEVVCGVPAEGAGTPQ